MKVKNGLTVSVTLISIALLLTLSQLLKINVVSELITFVFFIAFLLFFLYLFGKSKNYPVPISILIILLISFIFRSYYSYNVYTTIISPFNDSFGYLDNLNKLLNIEGLNFSIVEEAVGTSHFLYYYVLYFTYKIFNNYFSLYLINILLFCLSMLFLYRIAAKDFGGKIAYITVLISLFSANFLLFTSNILKDSLVLFLSILVVYIYKFGNRKTMPLLMIISGLLILTRIYAGFSIITAITIDVMINRKVFKSRATKIASFTTLIITLFVLFNYTFLSRYLELAKDFMNQYSLSQILGILPKSLFDFFFEPYPWAIFSGEYTVYSVLQIDSAFAIIFSFALVMFTFKFLVHKDLRSKMYFYLIPIIFHATVLGLAYGGGARQRIGAYAFVIMIFVIGALYKTKKTRT